MAPGGNTDACKPGLYTRHMRGAEDRPLRSMDLALRHLLGEAQ